MIGQQVLVGEALVSDGARLLLSEPALDGGALVGVAIRGDHGVGHGLVGNRALGAFIAYYVGHRRTTT